MSKSKVIFSKNCSQANINNQASLLTIQSRDAFGKYLGFPIFHEASNNGDFQFIRDNMNSKLAGWKAKFINTTGRTTLARASLNNIPNHVM